MVWAHASMSRHRTKRNSIFEKRWSRSGWFVLRHLGRFSTSPTKLRGRGAGAFFLFLVPDNSSSWRPTNLCGSLPKPESPPQTSAGKPDCPSTAFDQPLRIDWYKCLDDQAACTLVVADVSHCENCTNNVTACLWSIDRRRFRGQPTIDGRYPLPASVGPCPGRNCNDTKPYGRVASPSSS